MTILLIGSLLCLFGLVVMREGDYEVCLALVIFFYLFLPHPPAKAQPALQQCEHTLSNCDQLVTAQETQIKLLKAEVKAFQQAADVSHSAPIMLYTALGGAAAGAVMGEAGCVGKGGLVGAAVGAITGAGVGLILRGLGL